MNWQGVEKEYGVYDKEHLKKQVEQLKIAIKNGMYVFIDFHQDIFTKYIKDNAGFDGYGAPKWVIDGMNLKHRDAGCWIVKVGKIKKKCTAWSMSYFLNKGVVEANDKFWANYVLTLKGGLKVPVWDAFLDMVEATMSYFEENLTEEEFSYIIGLDPINEPAPGKLKVKDATRFINDRL